MIDLIVPVRWLHFSATVLAGGTAAFMVLMLQPAAQAAGGIARDAAASLAKRLTFIVWVALAMAVLSGAIWLALVAADIFGAPLAYVCLHGGVWQIATETRFGQIALLRAGLALAMALSLLWPKAHWAALAAAAGFTGALAWVGHAGAGIGPGSSIAVASDVVHLLAATAWLGALPGLAVLLRASGNGAEFRDLAVRATARFSWIGMVCVGALLVTGIVNGWNGLAGFGDLANTPYGRLVAAKIFVFAAMTGLAALNKFYLTPRLASPAGGLMLQRSIWAETGLGAGALLLVAIMGTMAPASHFHPQPPVPPGAGYTHIHGGAAMADVTVDPGDSGPVTITIRLMREDFSELPARSVDLILQPKVAGPAAVEAKAARMPDGTWRAANVFIPQRGIWTVVVTAAAQNGPPVVLDAPIVIGP